MGWDADSVRDITQERGDVTTPGIGPRPRSHEQPLNGTAL